MHKNLMPPPVIIEEMLVDSLSINLHESCELEPQSNKIQFTYTATAFFKAEAIRFRFMLEGFDNEWTDAGNRRVAYYTNLPRGRVYRFRVQACNADGVWNTIGASYSFAIKPYVYETWWFITLCCCVGGACIFGAYKLRVRQIHARAAELERIVQERTKRLQESNIELAAAHAELQRQMQLTESQAREIEITNTQLQESNERMKQLIAEKNEFLGIAAHDLKNPLSAIITIVSMMQRYSDRIDARSRLTYLQRIESITERMLRIISDLLSINQAEVGQLRMHMESLPVLEIVAQIVQQYQMIAQRKHIYLYAELPDQVVYVQADQDKLWEAIENLVSNAIKFSPSDKRVIVRVLSYDTCVRIEVCDEGPGLSTEDQAKLFQKFARLSARPTGGEHSTGLGLSIVKMMVEAMGGRVWCESELGKGATFIVELQSA
ncbi:MAG: ATP-binding protein, partial [Bacteroidota bacterium]|nr:ATP-binding protein [Candidatus Kapabacteria bacterium]MDW8221063.1 ATP-binding protein [Bacteroidota bacterium]